MLFIVRFTDRPDQLTVRKQFLQAHLQWLEKNQATVLVAGALRPDADSAPVGAMWIVEADGRADVERLFETDPFWVQGLRHTCEILQWSKAFPERRVPV
jgi:uncharacterized protein YciI